MPEPTVYLNGEYLPRAGAAMSVEDRGTLFGDGVYEVVRYYAGTPLAIDAHLARLRASLEGIRLAAPPAVRDLPAIGDELLRRNGLSDAKVYWQVTRGPAARTHTFPDTPEPTVLAIAYPAQPLGPADPVACWKAVLHNDARWADCWIKSLMLLPNVLARQAAREAGCNEGILHREGLITEGSSTNVLAVVEGALRTHPTDGRILAGVTRQIILGFAREAGLKVREQAVSVEELLAAEEVMLTGTTTHVAAVTHIDGRPIADGEPGAVTTRLHRMFVQDVTRRCGLSPRC